MTYTIEETDLERQHLLAEFLNPLSVKALENILLPPNAKILDIGCGLGDTTLMLYSCFPGSTITGLDGNASLIEAAIAEKKLLNPGLNFVCGDALNLPFEDGSFDFVFCRYIVQHLPDALAGLAEMKRVCKTGGTVFAQEPDGNSFQSYPESWAYPRLKEYVTLLFADILVGRKLISYFRQLELQNINHDVRIILADQNSVLKQFFAMTAFYLRKALMERKMADEKQIDEWVRELQRVAQDPETIVLMYPTIAVWGVKKDK